MQAAGRIETSGLLEADAEVEAAEARAAEARAHADELRMQVGCADDAPSPSRSRRRWRFPRPAKITGVLAVAVSIALLAASGYMLWFRHQVEQEHQRRAEFSAAASQAVVTLMSIDSANANGNVAAIVANSTGQFKDDFQSAADDFIKAAQDSKSATKATARVAAVESMTPDSAVVLVTAATTVSNSAGTDQQPRNWRLSVTMVRDDGQIKLSKVEFVP